MNFIDVAIAIICRSDAVLICQRKTVGAFAGLWEFPGGKVEPGETPAACVAREIREELSMTLLDARPLTPIEHVYPTAAIRLWPFICQGTGEPQPLASQQLKWVKPADLAAYAFPAANAGLIPQIIAMLSPPSSFG